MLLSDPVAGWCISIKFHLNWRVGGSTRMQESMLEGRIMIHAWKPGAPWSHEGGAWVSGLAFMSYREKKKDYQYLQPNLENQEKNQQKKEERLPIPSAQLGKSGKNQEKRKERLPVPPAQLGQSGKKDRKITSTSSPTWAPRTTTNLDLLPQKHMHV